MLPAYAKKLLSKRRGGMHPKQLTIIYADRWSAVDDATICVRQVDFERGKFDWSVVAGLPCRVVDEADVLFDFSPGVGGMVSPLAPREFNKFFWLLAEIAPLSPSVVVAHGGASFPIEDVAFWQRWMDAGVMRYPEWFGPDVHAAHTQCWLKAVTWPYRDFLKAHAVG